MTHEHLFQEHLPTNDLLFDGASYDLDWDGSRTTSSPGTPALPTLDYAIYLINAVKFHCGQTFHLFDEDSFMSGLYGFFGRQTDHPSGRRPGDDLWYVHFLLILAFGKAFVTQRNQGRRPPGAEYFTTALHLLPAIMLLWQDPVLSVEIMCCIALYFQCLDYRLVAHNYVSFPNSLRQTLGTDSSL